MRFIAAMQVSLDGYATAPDGEAEWVGSWADALGLVGPVDAIVLGRGMFEGRYEAYWDAALEGDASGFGREPYPRDKEYARLARETPHIVVSKTMTEAAWPNVRFARDVSELAALEGRTAYVAGGPGLMATLMQAGLLDELRLIVQPVILGGGMPLFGGVAHRRDLELVAAAPGAGGGVELTYRVP